MSATSCLTACLTSHVLSVLVVMFSVFGWAALLVGLWSEFRGIDRSLKRSVQIPPAEHFL